MNKTPLVRPSRTLRSPFGALKTIRCQCGRWALGDKDPRVAFLTSEEPKSVEPMSVDPMSVELMSTEPMSIEPMSIESIITLNNLNLSWIANFQG